MAAFGFEEARGGLRHAGAALRGLGAGLLGLALPPTCISCGKVTGQAGGLCGTCWGSVSFISRPYCERTGAPFAFDPGAPLISAEAQADPPAYDRARAAVAFEGVARDLVHNLKYADRLDLAAPMGRLMAQAGRELLADTDLLIPVPLHPLRLWRRRFNQAALLARHVAQASGIAARNGILVRRRGTASQTTLSRAERRANVADAFAVRRTAKNFVEGAKLLIVDDVFTTGATVDACARILRRSGAARVDVLTFARVVEIA